MFEGKLDCVFRSSEDESGYGNVIEIEERVDELIREVFLLNVLWECVEMDVVVFYFFGYRWGVGVLLMMVVFVGNGVFVSDLLEFFEFDNFYVVEGVIYEV